MSSKRVMSARSGVYSKILENREIERKFLVANLPDLGKYQCKEIVQAYILKSDDIEIRIRKEGDDYYQTIKKGLGLVRGEFETPTRKKDFDTLRSGLASGREIVKSRYYVPYADNTIFIDVYKGAQKGLVVAEVEFKSEQHAAEFVQPSWFGKEVTGDARYSNGTMALQNSGIRMLRRTPRARPLSLGQGIEYLKKKMDALDASQNGAFIVQIAGGSASGKTSMVAKKAYEAFIDRAVLISMDDYYNGAKYMEREKAKGNEINFDHPDSIDMPLLKWHLRQLKAGNSIEKPIYDFKTAERIGTENVEPKKIIILEGLFALNDEIAPEGKIRVFVDTGVHGRVIRRLLRDSERSSWKPIETMRYMMDVVEPMYRKYVGTTKSNADIVISNEYNPDKEANRSNIREVQIKYKLNLDQERLRAIGAERIMSSVQRDCYYAPENGQFKKTGELLRVRSEGNKIVLTYKGPRNGPLNERPKFEFEIDPEIERNLLSIYGSESKTIEKTRTLYRYNNLVFSIDGNVLKTENGRKTSLGDFIEMRFPENRIDESLAADLLRKLKADSPARIAESYHEM
ncbi:MAG: CYTH domain-containing protein [Candidatus Micrarchaeota archaeon]|nr:CYTH domain-containing protein [Candidatus Micrarchaeota archaeon]